MSLISFLLIIFIVGRPQGKYRFLIYPLCIVAVSIIAIQLTSLITTGHYVPALAISNIDEAMEIGNKNIEVFFLLIMALLLLLFFFLRKSTHNRKWYLRLVSLIFLLIGHTPINAMGKSVSDVIKERMLSTMYASENKKTMRIYLRSTYRKIVIKMITFQIRKT